MEAVCSPVLTFQYVLDSPVVIAEIYAASLSTPTRALVSTVLTFTVATFLPCQLVLEVDLSNTKIVLGVPLVLFMVLLLYLLLLCLLDFPEFG